LDRSNCNPPLMRVKCALFEILFEVSGVPNHSIHVCDLIFYVSDVLCIDTALNIFSLVIQILLRDSGRETGGTSLVQGGRGTSS
jgi:hypothetical protein